MKFLRKFFKKTEIQTGANNPILRQKAKKVGQITPAVLKLIKRMKDIISQNQYAQSGFCNVGLAAPQLGQSLQIIVFKNGLASEYLITLINPQITWLSKNTMSMEESCTSLPDTIVKVKRSTRVTVEGLDIESKKIKIKAKGFLARIIQHEVDHLNGILIVDKAQ